MIAANGGECAELVPFAYQFEKDGVIDHESIRQTVRRAKDAGIELVNYSVPADLCKTVAVFKKKCSAFACMWMVAALAGPYCARSIDVRFCRPCTAKNTRRI